MILGWAYLFSLSELGVDALWIGLMCFTARMDKAATNNNNLRGIVLLVIATVVFAAQDASTKSLTGLLPVGQIVFVRFAAFTVLALLLVRMRMPIRQAFKSQVPVKQVLRCLLMCAEISIFTFALRFIGVAEAHAIFSCFPLFIVALSVPVLGETVGWRRWSAVGLGFIGTIIILRPGSGVFDPAALLLILCAVIYAVYNLMTRLVSRHDRFETSLLYFGFVGLAASAVPAFLTWQAPTGKAAWLLLLVCLCSMVSHLLLIKSLELAEANVLQPFNYLILVWAMLMGWGFYGEILDAFAIGGAILVVASGIYVGFREASAASARKTPTSSSRA